MAKILVTKENKVLAKDNKIYTHTPKVSGVKNITSNGTYDVSDYAQAEVNVPQPTGKIEITSTEEIDVSNYAKAQVVDSNLEPQNIVKDVTILGVTGTFEGSGGSDTLKNLLDNTKHTKWLCSYYKGDNLSDLIQYNDTENVTDFENTFYMCQYATSIPMINTSKGTNFKMTFGSCRNATSFPLINTSKGIYFNYMYREAYKVTSFPLIDTSNGQEFSYMYENCNGATSFPQLDTSKGTSFNGMFQGCSKATTFPTLNTSNGTNFSYMYKNCNSATEFPQLDTSKGTNFASMYESCLNAIKIDISHYKISSTSNTNKWCYLCRSLKAVIIRSFGTSYVLNSAAFQYCYRILGTQIDIYNPNGEQDGYIYVPRAMIETLSSATNWSTLQFRALEDYTKDGTCEGEFDDVKAGLV